MKSIMFRFPRAIAVSVVCRTQMTVNEAWRENNSLLLYGVENTEVVQNVASLVPEEDSQEQVKVNP